MSWCLMLLALALTPEEIRARAAQLRGGDAEAWRTIPWAASVPEAVSLAAKEKRPLFVFSFEGNLDTGRC
ncbi:MAG: hypothetical protein SNJ82_09055 [Gemmataceae bacterium]